MFDWSDLFKEIQAKDYYKNLLLFLDNEYKNQKIYPPKELIWNAFDITKLDNLKVVIIGQDPYHEEGQAMGLAFSVPSNVPLPPSLINIYKEIENEYNIKMKKDGNLTYLAKQGVLLLNAILSVREHLALSHDIKEYRLLIKDILNFIDNLNQPIVFMLWGNNAKQYKKYIKNPNRLILTSVHPSPLSANRGGWFNNNHFILTNEYLTKKGLNPINWNNNL